MPSESTCVQLQYDPSLISVACSQTELSVSGKFVRSGKGSFSEKLKTLIMVLYVLYVKVHLLSLNKIMISTAQRVSRPSYPLWENFGRSGKGSLTEKAKIVNNSSLCIARESTFSKLQCDPYLISVSCSQTELSITGKFWQIRQRSFTEQAIIVNRGSLCSARESTCSELQYDPYLISFACSQTDLSILVKIWRSGNGSFTEKG